MHRNMPKFAFFIILALVAAASTGCSGRVKEPSDVEVASALNFSGGEVPFQQLGTFSTKLNATTGGRVNNIKKASETINMKVVQPGEEFSYNTTVGPTTQKNGYQLADIIVKGKREKGYGGGVCQVSSTLYNAAANAGMTITERHDHSAPVPYVAAGKEAATSYGGKDLKFINSKPFPVVIQSRVHDGDITVSVCAA